MNDNNIKLQKDRADKLITMIEWYLDDLKKYRKQLDGDFVKWYSDKMILYISDSISGKLKHLGVISRREMIDFEKTVRTFFVKRNKENNNEQ